MRIPSGWALLAGAILSKAAVADEGSIRFIFDTMQPLALNSSSGNKTSIYGVNQGGPSSPLVISWETNDGVVLDRFELYVVDPKNDNVEFLGFKLVERSHPPPTTVTATTAFTGSPPAPTNNCPFFNCGGGGPQKRGPSSAVDQRQAVDFIVSSAEKRLKIDDLASLIQFEARPLYFQAYLAGNIGSSFSRAFTALESGRDLPSWTERFFTDPKPIFPDGTKPTITSPNASQPTHSGESSQPSSNGGLPTGAIAGIAVGCAIVVLAIIGFLVWFFLRRRQQARDDDTLDAYRNGRTRTDELMAEKEANAGVDASPHSPYSDEGQRDSNSLHHVGTGAGATGAALVGNHKKGLSQSQSVHDRSYTPYSDRQESMARSPSTHAASIAAPSTVLGAPDSPIPSRAVPRGTLATPYAHLVEEGMTEEEIRRLEDEERALDAAIEQSTRRP